MAEAKKTPVKKTAKEEKEALAKIKAAEVAIVEKEAEEIVEEAIVEELKPTAKAGKHSAKAVKEAEEKAAKEERKASGEEADSKVFGQCHAADGRSHAELEHHIGEEGEGDGCYRLHSVQFFHVQQTQTGEGDGIDIGEAGHEGNDIQTATTRNIGKPGRAEQHNHE